MAQSSMASIAIIDYGSGNLRSAAKAFERVIAEKGLNIAVVLTSDPKQVQAADRIVLPGVGAFGDCMAGLGAIDGMIDTLNDVVVSGGRPFLGICVGMQLMASKGIEHGDHAGLGWIGGTVQLIEPNTPSDTVPSNPLPGAGNLKIPHMGWNTLRVLQNHSIFDGIPEDSHVYFVHSNHFVTDDESHRLAVVDYGGEITAVVGRDNMIGVQFHPEKSQNAGLQLISNFLDWNPS